MALDPIAVADDDQYVPRLTAQRNLPDDVKSGVAAFYGA
jgi:hypothetical protein